MIFCTYCNIQQPLDVDVLDFQFHLLHFGYSFGHISNNWAIFFNLLVTLPGTSIINYGRKKFYKIGPGSLGEKIP